MTPEDVKRLRESVGIPVKLLTCLCYNVYITLSVIVYSIAHNYPRITMLQVGHHTVRCYHIGLMSQKLAKIFTSFFTITVGSHEVVGKGYVFTKNSQIASICAISPPHITQSS